VTQEFLFAIRDDDTSFFTDPEELEAVYAPFWNIVPLSLAVVPFSVSAHKNRRLGSGCSEKAEMPLGENPELVGYLQEKAAHGQVEIMLHGYSHRYLEIAGRWRGEYAWKPERQLHEETARGKAYLETLLSTRVRVFVPPSNTIGKGGIRAIRKAGLNLSGIMGRGGDRPFSGDYCVAYLKRWIWRLFRGEAYPWPLRYGGHGELRAYALTPSAKAENLLRNLENCARIHAPFVLATHYWEFAECPPMRIVLRRLVERAQQLGARFCCVSRCFVNGRECTDDR
jgi:peptidoglycan/xylan/chitin deacetylase (PgdA/CDA1 family)